MSTTINLYSNVPFDSSYTDTIYFTSQSAQTAYFNSKLTNSFTNMSYQRATSSVLGEKPAFTVRLPINADSIRNCNYLSFNNNGTKTFYCFIREINFLNTNTAEVVYTIDDFQTWFLSCNFHQSFVLREHWVGTGDEPLFVNLEPEPVDIEELPPAIEVQTDNEPVKGVLVFALTDINGNYSGGRLVNNLYTGLVVYESVNDPDVITELLQHYSDGRFDDVIAIYPTTFFQNDINMNTNWECNFPVESFRTFGKISNNNTYTPHNKKLYSSPYCWFELYNGSGNIVKMLPQYMEAIRDLDIESTGNFSLDFFIQRVYGAPPVKMCTLVDNNIEDNDYNYTVTSTPPPLCGWTGSAYNNWLSQNAVSLAFSGITSIVGAIAGVASPAPLSGISGLVENVGNTLGTAYAVKQQGGIQGGNSNFGNIAMVNNRLGFNVALRQINPDNARRIDTFFDMFGYATNQMKIPNLTGRESWNYVQTQDCIITGNAPVESINNIKSMFNSGIRLWHGDFVGDYTRSNKVVLNNG